MFSELVLVHVPYARNAKMDFLINNRKYIISALGQKYIILFSEYFEPYIGACLIDDKIMCLMKKDGCTKKSSNIVFFT